MKINTHHKMYMVTYYSHIHTDTHTYARAHTDTPLNKWHQSLQFYASFQVHEQNRKSM